MKKIIFGIMLVFMSISCRADISSANSEALKHGVSQESNEQGNAGHEEDDEYMGRIAAIIAIILFGWWFCSYDEYTGKP